MITDILQADDIVQKLHDCFVGSDGDNQNLGKILTLCWQIWSKRNKLVFHNETFSPHSVVAAAAAFSKDPLASAAPLNVRRSSATAAIKWEPPQPNYVKINFDGSVLQQSGSAAMGFIMRDSHGCPLFAATERIGCSNVPIAEATALRESLRKARDLNFSKIEVEGDSSLIINCVKGTTRIPWRILSIIQDIQQILRGFEDFSIKHIFREANFAANALATMGHASSQRCEWSDSFPGNVLNMINFDLFGTGCQRGFSL